MKHRLAVVTLASLPMLAIALPRAPGPEAAESLAAALRGGAHVAGLAEVRFETASAGWQRTGLVLEEDQPVTLFAFVPELERGSAAGSTAKDLLWARVGAGEAFNVGSAVDSFQVVGHGELELAVRPRNVRFVDCRGTFPESALEGASPPPTMAVVAVAWSADLETSLGAHRELGPVGAALEDLHRSPRLPYGFQSLCYLPRTRLHAAWQEGDRVGVRAHGRGRAEIIKRAVDLPLGDDSEITFEWRYDEVPALGPETESRFHDYSSIAVEFDNGLDLTWMWSRHLEAEMSFRCPLRWWDERETHMVIQSGEEGLGQWHRHTRRVGVDYDRAIGAQRPARIVGIWFISNGGFGDTTVDATFANVTLSSGGQRFEVFARP